MMPSDMPCEQGPLPSQNLWTSCPLLLQVKGDVLPFCYLNEGLGAFRLPPAEEILAKRAVVVTCGASGLLREGFALFGTMALITFTHVLMDEAGQVRSPPQSHNIADMFLPYE